MRPFNTSHGGRRGNVTVIVVAFLALFLVLALTFAFYSIGEADQSKVYRDSANGGQTGVNPTTHDGAPPEPDTLFNTVLGEVIYGPPSGLPGAFNALRGHDLARLIYGWNPALPTDATQPYNGIGYVPPQTVHPVLATAPQLPTDASGNLNIVNWSWAYALTAIDPRMNFMYDPDNNFEYNPKIFPTAGAVEIPTNQPGVAGSTYRYYAKNGNYTYPDVNNMFLAALDPTTGKVLIPSYFRPWLMKDPSTGKNTPPATSDGSNNPQYAIDPSTGVEAATGISARMAFPSNSPNNVPNTNPWTNAYGRLQLLRPRPVDNMVNVGGVWQSFFPYPKQNPKLNPSDPNEPITYGDVENIEGKPWGRQYDALWMDPDFPVRRWQGKNYKPLVALTIIDLDSRINVNVAGNFYPLPANQQPPANVLAVVGPQYGHYSNMGAGMWEQNLSKVVNSNYYPGVGPISPATFGMTNPSNAQWDSNDAAHLSRPTLGPNIHNRFGNDGIPNRRFYTYRNELTTLNQPSPGSGAPFYGPVDFNGYPVYAGTNTPTRWGDSALTGTNYTTNTIFANPYYLINDPRLPPGSNPQPDPSSRYDNGLYILNQSGAVQYDERSNHPLMYNPFWLKPRTLSNPVTQDRTFGPEEVRFLNEKYNYLTPNGSVLAALAPNTLGLQGGPSQNGNYPVGKLNQRFAITPLSQDLNLPGASPWLGAGAQTPTFAGTTGSYPSWPTYTLTPSASNQAAPGTVANQPPTDFDPYYRAYLVSQLGPVDLNRKLTDYRTVTNQPLSPTNVGNYQRALQDRQDLAKDIFDRLRFVTTGELPTAPIPGTPGNTDPAYNARRWLAQLAVNIVDFIDNDDISTAFNWNTTQVRSVNNGWVYGVERPRLEMNETYTRIENNPKDPFQPSTMYPPDMQATLPFSLRCWIELHNALTPGSQGEQSYDPTGDATATDPTHGGYRTNLTENVYANPASPSGQPTAQTAYRILIYQQQVGQPLDPKVMSQGDNVTGLPQPTLTQPAGWPKVVDFTSAGGTQSTNGTTVLPNVGAQIQNQGAPGSNQSPGVNKTFFVLGPSDDATGGNDAKLPPASNPPYTADLTHKALSIEMDDKANGLGNNQDVGEVPDPNNPGKMLIGPKWVPFFVLQRLSNPYIPYNGTPTQATLGGDPTNQYVTIDYISPDNSANSQSVYDHIQWTGNGDRGTAANATSTQPDLNTTYAWGRRQPYDATIKWTENAAPYKYRQGAGGAALGTIGGQTFGKHNAMNGTWPQPAQPGGYSTSNESPGTQTADTLQVPFMPLNHLDRVLISPAELLYVAATKPHELTQLFYMADAGNSYRRLAYTANWLDNPDATNLGAAGTQRSTLLFRAFDFLRTGPFAEGIPTGGRIAGKVNLNTIHNGMAAGQLAPQFDAVADSQVQLANRFTPADVLNAWQGLVGNTGRLLSSAQQFLDGSDRPAKGSAIDVGTAGQPTGSNSQDRTLTKQGGLWHTTQLHDEDYAPNSNNLGALQKYELMSKTYQQFTTRSNCFAVYATIGYFEVLNDGPYDETNRPILGKELGTDEGTVTRNKFMAVIDRTNLNLDMTTNLQATPPVYFTYEPDVPLANGNGPTGFAVIPDPDLTPPTGQAVTAVQCRIPATVQYPPPPAVATQLSGYYDGTTWSIANGKSFAVLDVGPKQELCVVGLPQTGPAYDPNSGAGTIILQPVNQNASGTVAFRYRHSRGAPIRLVNVDPSQLGAFPVGTTLVPTNVPGNPGPQAGFNYHTGRYAPVVRYAEQLR